MRRPRSDIATDNSFMGGGDGGDGDGDDLDDSAAIGESSGNEMMTR